MSHFIGAANASSEHRTIVRRIVEEIAVRYGLESELPATSSRYEAELPHWLGKVQNEKLVIVIDAMNQLLEQHLHWLPAYLPPNVRLIVSSTPGVTYERWREREWPMISVQPLSILEREAMIVRFLGEYHKSLTTQQNKRIAQDVKSESPLFLRVLLEELRLFGTFEELDAHIDHYLTSEHLDDLFRKVLDRIEGDFEDVPVPNVMRAIWASRHGISETELMEYTGLKRVQLSQLLIALEYHLIQRDGSLTFFHDYLRLAVERRYLETDEARRAAHARIAGYFSKTPYSMRRKQEETWQWREAGELENLKHLVTDARYFDEPGGTERTLYEKLGYWLQFNDRSELTTLLLDQLNDMNHRERGSARYVSTLESAANFLLEAGAYTESETLLKEAIECRTQLGDDLTLASTLTYLGDLYERLARYSEAESVLRRALGIRESYLHPSHPEVTDALEKLASLQYHLGQYSVAEENLTRLLRLVERSYGSPSSVLLSKILSSLGAVYYAQRRDNEAETAWRRALELDASHPNRRRAVADDLNNLAVVLIRARDYDQAIHHMEEATRIFTELLGSAHLDTVATLVNLASAYRAIDQLDTSETYLRSAITQLQTRPDHPLLGKALGNLAEMMKQEGDLSQAEALHYQSLETFRRALSSAHPSVITSARSLAAVLRDQGKVAEAIATLTPLVSQSDLSPDSPVHTMLRSLQQLERERSE